MRVSDRDVMLLFDGELDPHRTRSLGASRAADASLDARLGGLAQLAAFTRVWAERQGTAEKRRLARERPRRQRVALGGIALVLSLSVALVLPRLGAVATAGPAVASGAPGMRSPVLPAVAVESIDFGSHPGTIFSVPGAVSETTVVWLSEDPEGASSAAL